MPTTVLKGVVYPFDPTGTAATNLVRNEQQIITAVNWRDYHFIVPRLAPFFGDTLQMTYTSPDGVTYPLVMGRDWYLSHCFADASAACAKPIYGSISFLNTQLSGSVAITYQTIGGEWTLDEAEIAKILADKIHNPRITTWEQVVEMPIRFPVIDHDYDLVDMVGCSKVVEKLGDIEVEIRNKGEGGLQNHIADKTNPHAVTKAQVDLGSVENFPVATKLEAVAGLAANRYMTPLRVSEAIAGQAGDNLATHINDKNNPHGVTPAIIGSYSKAEANNLLAGKLGVSATAADSSKFGALTPVQYKAEVLTGTSANSIRFSGLTLQELKLEIQGGASANAERFGNMTPAEYKEFALDGTASNASSFHNMNKDQYKTFVLSGKSADTSSFDGMDKLTYKAYALDGKAADSFKFDGMTPAQFRATITAATASNALRFDGRSYEEAKVDFLKGTASNSMKLGGMSSAEIIAAAANGTVANANTLGGKTLQEIMQDVSVSTVDNSNRFGGKTPSEWLGTIDNVLTETASQMVHQANTNQAVGTYWHKLATLTLSRGLGGGVHYNDFIWLLAGGDNATSTDSGLVQIRGSSRSASGFKLIVRDLGFVTTKTTFGYTSVAGSDANSLVITIYAKMSENNCRYALTELLETTGMVLQDPLHPVIVNTEPAGIVYSTISTGELVTTPEFNAYKTQVDATFTSMSEAFRQIEQLLRS